MGAFHSRELGMSVPKKPLGDDKISIPGAAKKPAAPPHKAVSVEVGYVGVGKSRLNLGRGDRGEYERYLASRDAAAAQPSLLAKLAGWLGLRRS